MNKQTYGKGTSCYVMPLATVADTAAHVSTVVDLSGVDTFVAQLIAGGGAATLDGAWKVEISNDYTPGQAGGAADGQRDTTATWTTITASALWVDAVAAVAHGTAASTNQFLAPKYALGARAIRFTFTGTTGSATVGVIFFAKSWS